MVERSHAASSHRVAVVLGASGSVGQALVAALLRHGSFSQVVTLVRRAQPAQQAQAAGVELDQVLLASMSPASLEGATRKVVASLPGEAVGLSVLGVGAGTAKLTFQAHWDVDVALNLAFARGLRATGRVPHLALMSAVGADPTAATTGSGAPGLARYARVKGEAEQAVRQHGPATVSIFRPAMIVGSQHTPWLLEKLLPAFSWATPSKYRSITVEQIARAMVAVSANPPSTSEVYHFSEMVALGR